MRSAEWTELTRQISALVAVSKEAVAKAAG